MNENKLSLRLQSVADLVPKGARLADIGSDHGYLPSYLLLNNKINYAVAGEVVEGPFEAAQQVVLENDLSDRLTVRLADGLAAIKEEDQIDVITICGMGGVLIADILEKGKQNQQLKGSEQLLLQPNVGEMQLREWLMANSYEITSENILKENDKIYEIIAANKVSEKPKYTEMKLRFGPFLLKEKNDIFLEKWLSEEKKLNKIYNELKNAKVKQIEKLTMIEKQLKMIRELVKCH